MMMRATLVDTMSVLLLLLWTISAQAQTDPKLRTELLAMEKADQDARIICTNGKADEQVKCLAEISKKIDEPNTKRLAEILDKFGFPDTAKVGREGLEAFLVVLQHARTDDVRVRSLKPITKAFKHKEIPPADYANFVDRLRLHQGKKQVYGTSFDFKNGRMELSPTEDMKGLEKRRAEIGLPPMSEAIQMMKELYHLDVVVPRN